MKGVGTGICSHGFPAVETDLFGLACDVLGDDIAFCVGFEVGGRDHVYCFRIGKGNKVHDIVVFSFGGEGSVSLYTLIKGGTKGRENMKGRKNTNKEYGYRDSDKKRRSEKNIKTEET